MGPVVACAQSEFVLHGTQTCPGCRHTGVAGGHAAPLAQEATHWSDSHTRPLPHSPSVTHCTHCPEAVSQCMPAEAQSVSEAHPAWAPAPESARASPSGTAAASATPVSAGWPLSGTVLVSTTLTSANAVPPSTTAWSGASNTHWSVPQAPSARTSTDAAAATIAAAPLTGPPRAPPPPLRARTRSGIAPGSLSLPLACAP